VSDDLAAAILDHLPSPIGAVVRERGEDRKGSRWGGADAWVPQLQHQGQLGGEPFLPMLGHVLTISSNSEFRVSQSPSRDSGRSETVRGELHSRLSRPPKPPHHSPREVGEPLWR
jgi:hypothetical protein